MLVLTGLLTQFISIVKPVVLLPLVRSQEVTKRVTDTTTHLVLEEEPLGRNKTLLLYVVTVKNFKFNVLSVIICKTFIKLFLNNKLSTLIY